MTLSPLSRSGSWFSKRLTFPRQSGFTSTISATTCCLCSISLHEKEIKSLMTDGTHCFSTYLSNSNACKAESDFRGSKPKQWYKSRELRRQCWAICMKAKGSENYRKLRETYWKLTKSSSRKFRRQFPEPYGFCSFTPARRLMSCRFTLHNCGRPQSYVRPLRSDVTSTEIHGVKH